MSVRLAAATPDPRMTAEEQTAQLAQTKPVVFIRQDTDVRAEPRPEGALVGCLRGNQIVERWAGGSPGRAARVRQRLDRLGTGAGDPRAWLPRWVGQPAGRPGLPIAG